MTISVRLNDKDIELALNCCKAAMERKIRKEEKLKKEPASYII